MAATDRDVLVALYSATDGPIWNRKTNWGTDAPLSDWYGVKANDQGRVVELSLPSNILRGFTVYLRTCVVLSCGVLDLSQEIADRTRSFHEIASFTGSHNVAFLIRPCVLHTVYA